MKREDSAGGTPCPPSIYLHIWPTIADLWAPEGIDSRIKATKGKRKAACDNFARKMATGLSVIQYLQDSPVSVEHLLEIWFTELLKLDWGTPQDMARATATAARLLEWPVPDSVKLHLDATQE